MPSILRSVALALTFALSLLWALAAAADDQQAIDLEATRGALTAIETALKDPNLTEQDLLRLRSQNDPLAVALQGAIADWTPRLAASAKRLAELTPKAKDKDANAAPPAPETDAAAAELDNEKKRHDALDANLRTARAMLLEVDDNTTRIGARRREVFASEIFAPSSSIFNPALWGAVAGEVPFVAATLTARVETWLTSLGRRVTPAAAIGGAALLVALALAALPVRRIARRVIFRDPGAKSPSRLKRALAAGWTLIVLAVLPLIALLALSNALIAFDLATPQVQGVVKAVLEGAALLMLGNGVGRSMLSPKAAAWRLVPVGDRTARLLFRDGMTIAAIWAAERLVEPAADVGASLNIAVAGRGVGAVLVALVAAHALRRLAPPEAANVAPAVRDPYAPARTLGWIAVLVVFGAAAMGYVAFAAYLINRAVFLTILACILYLIDVVIHDGTERLLDADSVTGARLRAMFGLRRNVLGQLVVILQGLVRVVIIMIAAAAVLERWGVQSQDWFSSLRAAYFGFAVGGVTLSLSSLLAAALVFAAAIFVTRVIQGWLSERLLPQTRLDAGVRNSIGVIFGYVGAAVAVLLAAGRVGLDVQKLAIVAGALSVGIGFGLQSIANNFVSGLIILWERSVRVGDWVMVGADQGFVRRINARSTEIETFDRATLIVPNSNLITGVVKNWVNPDRIGRILIPINVDYASDVETVRETLIGAAKAQDLVLKIPAPSVALAEFGDWALKFNLVCFVDDVETANRIQSELSFDILRRMREAGVRIATLPPGAAPRPATT